MRDVGVKKELGLELLVAWYGEGSQRPRGHRLDRFDGTLAMQPEDAVGARLLVHHEEMLLGDLREMRHGVRGDGRDVAAEDDVRTVSGQSGLRRRAQKRRKKYRF